jgi:hypothetical protein
MNNMSPADDEFLSSYLDGEATPEGIARIESDSTLLARVEELRAARDLIATPVTPLSAPDVDALVGAALEASATSPVVTGMEQARRRRSDRTRTMVAIAAGVLLLAIAVPVLNTISSDSGSDDTAAVEMDASASDDDTTAGDDGFTMEAVPADETSDDDTTAGDDDMAADEVPDDDADDSFAHGDDDAEGATDPTATSQNRAGLHSIERVLDQAELENAVRARLDEYDSVPAFEADELADLQPVACAEEFAFLTSTDELTLVDSGVTAVGGTATAVVLVLQGDTGDYLLYATPLETCTPIAVLDLDG